MLKLLSKESNIFSIPIYIGFLLFIVIAFNVLDFIAIGSISATITFAGIALGYFLFNKIDLTYQTHLPLFLYTFFVFALYPGNLDIGLSIALLTNSFLLLILTSDNEDINKKFYVLAGVILAINYFFLPTTWPMAIFVIVHISSTSKKVLQNLFRLFFGMLIILLSYLGVMYLINYTTYNPENFPMVLDKPMKSFYPYTVLSPVILMIIVAVINHFQNYNKKSPLSRFKYTFLLLFSLAQLTTVILYMGGSHEYLLLLALPASIILSRYLRFLPKYWIKEFGLWLIIVCLIFFKIATYYDLIELFFV